MNLHKLIWGTVMLALVLFVAGAPSGARPRPGATPAPKKAPLDKASTMATKSALTSEETSEDVRLKAAQSVLTALKCLGLELEARPPKKLRTTN